jgi:DNA-binding NarL/FixJ family response regulator
MNTPAATPIRVLIADDHPMMREGIAPSLAAHGGIEVVAQAGDGDEAISSFTRLRPDVALIDLQMPGKDGLEAIRAIRSLHPDARLVVLTTYDGDARIAAALKTGASACLLKNVPGREIGARLHIGETTVKTHMSAILVKLGANDRAHAVTLAVQRGYMDLRPTVR